MATFAARRLIELGRHEPLGATPLGGGTNFAVFSGAAERLELCLFDTDGNETHRIDLPGQTDGVWHGFLPGVGPGQRYGFRAHGAYEPSSGLRFNPHKLLLDPYARRWAGAFRWNDAVFDFIRLPESETLAPSDIDSAPFMPKAEVMAALGQAASHCRRDASETVIYELNVRGYTMGHPAVSGPERGTFAGMRTSAVVEHLKSLGITSVEIMPIHALIDEEFLRAKRLRNFWGYNSLGFFAPDARFLASGRVEEVRQLVDTLHDANIEVLLDVVYNHTAEGGRLGPTLSFRGLDNGAYYRLLPADQGEYINDTGCGNTLNTDHPIVRRLIVDSLSYWSEEIGIDGFRFDLATILGRTRHGFDREHPLFEEIRRAPALARTKLIAEPWDIGPGGYQLGGFPSDWAEWNDRYRDAVRSYWRKDQHAAPELARRVHGSADLFEASGRGPTASVNFVACHDGFTSADLVSYLERHNEANGEDNRDGHQHNLSANHGIEGPSNDLATVAARRRHRLSLLATVLFSQGTPLLLAGDEIGNSQGGNNNAYCQDNTTGWVDWAGLESDPGFLTDVQALLRLRRELPLLRQSRYRHGERVDSATHANIEWVNSAGAVIEPEEWSSIAALGLLLAAGEGDEPVGHGTRAVCILFNAPDTAIEFRLPVLRAAGHWTCRYANSPDTKLAGDGRRIRVAGGGIACLVYGPRHGRMRIGADRDGAKRESAKRATAHRATGRRASRGGSA